jgi:hypothetical protein
MSLLSRYSSVVTAALACFAMAGCAAPRNGGGNLYEELPSDTGVVVDTAGDTITVLIRDKLVTIRLEGFADEGAAVAAAVRRSPAHASYASGAIAAAD